MLNNKFKEVIRNLEENIDNEKDLIYAKSQVTELTMGYLEELEKIENLYKQKVAMCEHRFDGLVLQLVRLDNEVFQ